MESHHYLATNVHYGPEQACQNKVITFAKRSHFFDRGDTLAGSNTYSNEFYGSNYSDAVVLKSLSLRSP